jgi:ubiquinone biosynthesis protein COQ9
MTLERSPERDAAIDALLPHVSERGWARDSTDGLFISTTDLIEAFCDLADRRMTEATPALDLPSMRIPARIRAIIALRLHQQAPNRDAIRRALAILALPRHAASATRCTARTVDEIWHAAGDTSADFSWYTKRLLLTGVYTTTLLFWLNDSSEDFQDTMAFLDRRLAGIGRITSLRRKLQSRFRPDKAAA